MDTFRMTDNSVSIYKADKLHISDATQVSFYSSLEIISLNFLSSRGPRSSFKFHVTKTAEQNLHSAYHLQIEFVLMRQTHE